MQLDFREYGDPASPTVLLIHGLFGASSNWHGIARRLEERFHVISPDLRNHGRSPHDESMDYPAMSADLLALLDHLDLEQSTLVGHSMGGKAAMWLALQHPERVRGLVPVDMAPVSYSHSFDGILGAMDAVPLKSLAKRADADAVMAEHLDESSLRAYLLQNLVKENGAWRWRINLSALRLHIREITGFPDVEGSAQFLGDTLFIYGGQSGYVSEAHLPRIRALLPFARLRMIPQAGHWVYSEAPDSFFAVLTPFLEQM